MVAVLEQGLGQRADRRHAGAEAQRGHAAFHLADLVFQRRQKAVEAKAAVTAPKVNPEKPPEA